MDFPVHMIPALFPLLVFGTYAVRMFYKAFVA